MSQGSWIFVGLFILSFISICYPIRLLNVMAWLPPLSNVESFLIALFPTLLIISPLFLVRKAWRWTVLIPVWLIPIFAMANIWYYNFFEDFLPIANIFAFSNYDPVLFNSVFSVAKLIHFRCIIFPLLTTFYVIYVGKILAVYNLKKNIRLLLCTLCILSFVGYEGWYIVNPVEVAPSIKENRTFVKRLTTRYLVFDNYNSKVSYWEKGFVTHIVSGINNIFFRNNRSRELHNNKICRISKFWEEHDKMANPNDSLINAFKGNYHKNLIFIVVESWNAGAALCEINEQKVMPNLAALINEKGSISCLDVVSQIHSGISSDGQFILNTGMLPSSTETTVFSYENNVFHALPKQLNHRSAEIIFEKATFWTNKSYGYDGMVFDLERLRNISEGCDATLLKKCLSEMQNCNLPCYYFITTIDMHADYYVAPENRRPWINNAKGLSDQRKAYYNCCNIFDEVLGNFIEGLKKAGKYDNSVIVLASDHAGLLDGKRQEQPIAFVALNTGVHMKIDRPVQQIDIYPTILEIMGRYPSKTNNGMGYSVLNPNPATWFDPNNKARQDSLQQIANDMLFGDWYRKYAGKISN